MYFEKLLALVIMTFALSMSQTVSAAKYSINSVMRTKAAIGGLNLDRMVLNEGNDVMVQYKNPQEKNIVTQPLNVQTQKYRSIKALVQGSAGSKMIHLRDYLYMPMTFTRFLDNDSLLKALNDPNVEAIYPNRKNSTSLASSLPFINQPQAIDANITGKNTIVAVLDTGVDYTRSAFGSCTTPGTASCKVLSSTDQALNDNTLDTGDYHGTNVSAIVVGVAPNTKLVVYDVFRTLANGQEGAYDSDIIAALNNIKLNTTGRTDGNQIAAVNMSLGAYNSSYQMNCNSSYSQPINDLKASGVATVISSGNDGFSSGINSPACVAGAIAVGAVYDSNIGGLSYSSCTDSTSSADKVACFSNSGTLLKLLAPGTAITAGGITMYGTSQASPHVAGAFALLKDTDALPNESVDELTKILVDTGKPVIDSRNGLTRSRIDVGAAVLSVTTGWLAPVVNLVTSS